MQRPYIICHMMMSIDGKVTGNFLFNEECEKATAVYYDINRNLQTNGFICGRTTMEESFTNGYYPVIDSLDEVVDRVDYVPEELSGFYAVAFDTNGRLGWRSNRIVDDDPGYGGAQVIEVLSENVDGKYLFYLQMLKIPYVFAGETEIDVNVALYKLKNIFNIDTLLLEGGSEINGAFERSNAIDELSLVVSPVVADKESKPLFYDSIISNYELMKTNVENGVLVLNYKKTD